MTPDDFPLFLLQPVDGPGSSWSALRITCGVDTGASFLGRIFGEFGLAEATGSLPCLLPAQVLARLDPAALPAGLVLRDDAGMPPWSGGTPVASSGGPAQAILLKLLNQVAGDAETRDLESTLKQDPQLSIQLLRLVNSVAYGPGTRINSFAHAITLLGRRQLQRWLQLLLYASRSSAAGSNALLARAAYRAALMEALCKAARRDRAVQDEAFMVGMFSLLDRLFGKPLEEIVGPLNLVGDVTDALLRRTGKLGELLALAEAGENGDPARIEQGLMRMGVGNEAWCRAQIEALRWALQVGKDA